MAGWHLGAAVALLPAAAAGALSRGRRASVAIALVAIAAGAWSGSAAAGRAAGTASALLPSGPVTAVVRVVGDPVEQWGEPVAAVEPTHLLREDGWQAWEGPRLRMAVEDAVVTAGELLVVEGAIIPGAGRFRGDPIAGRLAVRRIEPAGTSDPLFRAGNLLRDRVEAGLSPFRPRPSAALLAGFLIGDVRELPDDESDALRRTGLTHFVAVSGSNVALFLAAWWVALGPLGWSPRLRAGLGMAGLALFVVVTRWEPSVVRAAAMAAVVLGGRWAGVPIDGWTAFGAAVAGLLAIAGDLAFDVGFQLSAAATAGILAGAGVWRDRRPRWAWAALGATAAAQLAVAPLLLVHFGTVPLLAPIANLVAAPLVALSTAAGGIGVMTGIGPLTGAGVAVADLVLGVARAGRDLPQLGWVGVLCVAGAGALALRRGLRPLMAVTAAGVLAAWIVLPGLPPRSPEMIVLDVGQGDAVLLRDPSGAVVLVDGGPDPAVLRSALRRRRIDRIDLLVITHQHADHTTGLGGITGYASVGLVWSMSHSEGPAAAALEELAASGSAVSNPEPGVLLGVGSFEVEVLGPLRRYASPNDASIVLLIRASGTTALLPGDIEVIAQREIGPVTADILKVPHQGAATSDPDWLAGVGAAVAVVSVGPNDYGHPSAEVIAVLEEAGARVLRTDVHGDVTVPFGAEAAGRTTPLR